jgi:hypothetical protein
MSYQDTRNVIDYMLAQFSAESLLVGKSTDTEIGDALKNGPNNPEFDIPEEERSATRATNVMAAEFLNTWEILHHLPNQDSGFSATVLKHKVTGEVTISFRSTESLPRSLGGDMERDAGDGADGEILTVGFAIGQIAEMERYYSELVSGNGEFVADISPAAVLEIQAAFASNTVNVTGYSLGGHLAQVFTLLHYEEAYS